MSERYLANENFPGVMVSLLRNQGHDVLYAAETLVAAADRLVLETALSQDRVVLTFDRDFGELVFRHRKPPAPGIVLFRLVPCHPTHCYHFCKTSSPLNRHSETISRSEPRSLSPSFVECRPEKASVIFRHPPATARSTKARY